MKTTEQIINELPSSTTNNSRQIVRDLMRKFDKQPSEMLAHRIENMTGISADFLDSDWGTGERGSHFNE